MVLASDYQMLNLSYFSLFDLASSRYHSFLPFTFELARIIVVVAAK
jgi:hypothetical protein